MTPGPATGVQLRAEISELRARLEEADDTLRAIRMGEVDSLVVETENGPQVFSLDTAEAASNRLRGEILAQVADAVVMIDNDERITYLNPALERLYRVQPGEMLGRQLSELYQRRWLKPGDEAAANATLREHGEAIWELIHITRDGREMHVQSSVCVMRDAAGHATGIITAIRDITERKLAEAQLHEGGERLRLAMDAAQMGSWAWEMTTDEVFWSPYHEILLGYEPGTPRRSYAEFRERVHPEDLERVEATMNEATGKRTDYRCEFRVVWPDASVHWIAAFGRFQFDSEGRPVRLNGMVQEITALKQAEERLRTSEKQVRQVIDSMFTFIGMIAPDGTLIDANHAALAAAGLIPSDVLGRPFWDCHWWAYDPAVQDRLRAGFDRAVRGEVVRYEETIRAVGDARIIIDFMLQPVFDGGRLMFIIPSAQDITARKHAEETIARHVRELDSLYTTTPTGLFQFDAGLRHVRVNALMAAINGRSIEAHIGRTVGEVLPPELAAQVERPIRQVLQTGEPILELEIHGTTPAQLEERDWLASYHPVRSAYGAVVGVHGVMQDITARKLAEARLRESETRMRLATEATAVGVWELNATTHTLRWDAQMFRIYGIAPTTDGVVQYSDWSGAVLPEDLVESERVFEDTVRRREFRIHRRDDREVRNIEAVEALRMNQQGEAEWVVGTNLDVTERKHAERQLHELANRLTEADQRKDQFLATLAHELRNPLAPVSNALELLKRESGDAELFTHAREIMERQIAQIVRLTDDLLDVSRIGRNTVELKTAPIELASVIHHAVEECQPHLDRFRHKFVLTVPSAPIHLQGDATRLTQVIGNLLTNASKYSDAGGTIWLTVQRESSDVEIIVKDTGIGMPPEMLGQVFDMFTQIDTSVERSVGGLGIGLWLVKQLVELHGGTVTAHSDGLGHGSEFTVRLPMLVDQPRTEAPAQLPGAAPIDASGRRILVVDDNFDNVTTLSLLLKHTGNEVRTASDGLEAIATAETFRPDVIFLDIGLPKLNGHDTCRAIRKQPWGTGILIFALTGWGREEDRRKSADAGFDVHLVKPVDYRALNDLILKLKPRATADA